MSELLTRTSLPLPEFPMKPRERKVFRAEQEFLERLQEVVAPEADPDQQREALKRHLTDLSSTQIAGEVLYAYGYTNGECHSAQEVAGEFGIHYKAVDGHRRAALQALWLMHGDELPPDFSPAEALSERYLKKGEAPSTGKQLQVLNRAHGNLGFHKDREFILEREEEVLELLKGLYGEETRALFARAYRLGEYVETDHHERRGNFSSEPLSNKEKLKLIDALEVGRATAEHVAELEHGSREWTNMKGNKVRGYQRRGTRFPTIVKDYQRQERVAQALKGPRVEIEPTERELLTLTTEARLQGQDKVEGLRAFNERYSTNYGPIFVTELERKVLGQFEGDRLLAVEIPRKMEVLLGDPRIKEKLARTLASILYDYHFVEKSLAQIGDDVLLSKDHVGELKRLMDRLISKRHGWSLTEFPWRGDLTPEMIDELFPDNKLPLEVMEILQEFTHPIRVVDVAEEHLSHLNLKRPRNAVAALRKLALRIVKDYETSRSDVSGA